MKFLQKLLGIFKKPAHASQPKVRKSHRLSLGDFILLELRKGPGTSLEIAQRLNAHHGSVGNLMSILKSEGKIRQVDKKGRFIVWDLS